MADQLKVTKHLPPKVQSKQEKKKKGPSKPQPAWLFPPDEENPVLNPKEKSHAEVEKAIKEREKAVDYMQRRVHGVPDRPAPDPILLTLIGVFLTDFGFNSTSRLFTNERQARQTLNGWEEALGKKIDKKTPKLEQIFRDWYREWAIKQGGETSSSESSSGGSSDAESEAETQIDQEEKIDVEESGSSSTDSDVEMKDAPQPKKTKKTTKTKRMPSPSPSVLSSSSDSDADDEKENTAPSAESSPKKASKATASKTASKAIVVKPTVGDMMNKLKRKAPAEESVSNSPEEDKPAKAKKTKIESAMPVKTRKEHKSSEVKNDGESAVQLTSTKKSKATKSKAESAPFSASPFASNAGSDEVSSKKQRKAFPLAVLQTASSDSSATINGDSIKPSANASSSSISSSSATPTSSDSDEAATAPQTEKSDPPASKVTEKKAHKGAKPTPLAEMSEVADADAHPSNQYQSYNYADRAYKDLSVTRGKGFTKEKNKKKRGSYRGGAIDTSGGKSFKFED